MSLPRSLRLGFCALALASVGRSAIADENPVEFKDPGGAYVLMLPLRWKSDPSSVDPKASGITIGFFKGWFSLADSDVPHAVLRIASVPSCSRALLALGALHEAFGTEMEGTRLVGADFAESVRLGLNKSPDVIVLRRCIEKDGSVLLVELGTAKQSYVDNKDVIRALLDSVRITGKPPGPKAPAGFKLVAEKEFEVWTDAAPASKGVAGSLDLIRKAWAAVRDLLPTDGFGMLKPRFVLYSKEDDFRLALGGGDVSSNVFVDASGVAQVNLSKFGSALYVPKLRVSAAMLSVRAWFGGEIPFFLSEGLSFVTTSGLESDGKPAKPAGARLSLARNAVKESGDQTLLALIDKGWTAMTKDEAASHVAWAWHCWFRFGDSTADDRKLYDKAMSSLRTNGDVQAWRAVWTETDQAKLAARFHAWMAKWKP